MIGRNVDLAIIHHPIPAVPRPTPSCSVCGPDYDWTAAWAAWPPTASTASLRAKSQAVRDVVTAIAKAGNWVNANTDEARRYTAERLGMELKHVERYAYVDDQIITEPHFIQYYIDVLEREGKLQLGKVAVKDVYTNTF